MINKEVFHRRTASQACSRSQIYLGSEPYRIHHSDALGDLQEDPAADEVRIIGRPWRGEPEYDSVDLFGQFVSTDRAAGGYPDPE